MRSSRQLWVLDRRNVTPVGGKGSCVVHTLRLTIREKRNETGQDGTTRRTMTILGRTTLGLDNLNILCGGYGPGYRLGGKYP